MASLTRAVRLARSLPAGTRGGGWEAGGGGFGFEEDLVLADELSAAAACGGKSGMGGVCALRAGGG